MERLLVALVTVLILFSFSMVGFAQEQSTMGTQQQPALKKKMDHKEKVGSISMTQLANAEYALYSGIGDAMIWSLVASSSCPSPSGGKLSWLDESSGSESQTTGAPGSGHGA